MFCYRFGIFGSHDGTDDGNTIETFARRMRLVVDPLCVGRVNATDTYGRNLALQSRQSSQNLLDASGSDDGLRVFLAAQWLAQRRRYVAAATTGVATSYVGVAYTVPIPK